ncbi:MAG: histidine phosphatase family protein [Candidatus Pacearchaeota archaeon]|nr:histidine phosphatase family protein [Candidatus Pacearchaeota archaeon]
MEKLNYQQVIIVRHGEHRKERLTEKGKKQLTHTAQLISPLLIESTIIPFSSYYRRTNESLFVLQDQLIDKEGNYISNEWNISDKALWGNVSEEEYDNFIKKANERKRGKIMLAVGHSPALAQFPYIIASDYCDKELPDYEYGLGEGIFFNKETREAKIISLEKGIIEI